MNISRICIVLLVMIGQISWAQWEQAEIYKTSAIVKVHVPNFETNGSGLLIGQTGNTCYVLTAAHVVADPDEPKIALDPTEKITVKIQEYDADGITLGSQGLVIAKIHFFDPKLDLAVLAFNWSDLPKSKTGRTMTAIKTNIGFTKISECNVNEMAKLKAFSGGSQSSFDQIELMIQGIKYYGDEKAFRMEAESVEGGHSGGAVFNSNNDWIGVMIKKNGEGTACKVLNLTTILTVLNSNNIAVNWLIPPVLATRWVPVGIVGSDKQLKAFPPSSPILIIKNDGSLAGLTSGSICIKNKEIRFVNIPNGAVMLEPIHNGTDSFNPHLAVIEESKVYKMQSSENPVQQGTLTQLKLICDKYEFWLTPAAAMGR